MDEPCTYKVMTGKEGLTEVHIEYPFVPYTCVGLLEAQLQLDLYGNGKMRIPTEVVSKADVVAGVSSLKKKLSDARAAQDVVDSGWVS